jgi:hypothetical protein
MFKRMKNAWQRSSRRRLVWLAAALLLVAAGLTVSARTWLSPGEMNAKSLAVSSPLQSSPNVQEQERGLIRLLTSGFSQTEVTGTGGQYRLVMTRASQDEAVVLQLKRESGELVQEITMPQEKLNWTTLVELEAGSYTLTVTNHPQWVCNISIQ